jgi:hypothetical protein
VTEVHPCGKREEAGRPGGHGLQQSLPGHSVKNVPQVQLLGHVLGQHDKARPQSVANTLATLRDADPELGKLTLSKGARDG